MIDHDNKLIFLHIPKTGGGSVETYFTGAPIGNPHRTALKVLSRLEDFADYYIFTFIRDPIERMVSVYRYYSEGGNQSRQDKAIKKWITKRTFSDFVSALPTVEGCPHYKEIETMLLPQVSYISPAVKVFSFDNLESVVQDISRRVGLAVKPLPHHRQSTIDRPVVRAEDEEALRALYHKDYLYIKDFALCE